MTLQITPYWAGLRKHKAHPGAVWEGSTIEISKSPPYWAGLRKHKAHPGAVWEGSTIELSKSPPYWPGLRKHKEHPGAVYGRTPKLKLINHPHIGLS